MHFVGGACCVWAYSDLYYWIKMDDTCVSFQRHISSNICCHRCCGDVIFGHRVLMLLNYWCSLLQPITRGQSVSGCCNLSYEESFVVDITQMFWNHLNHVLKSFSPSFFCLLHVRHEWSRWRWQKLILNKHLHAQIILHILFCAHTSAG